MNLPEDDEAFLRGKGFDWSLIPDGDGGMLIVKGYAVSITKYDRAATDLMIRIPAQYNMAKLDMWYVDPPLRLKGTSQLPNQAEVFENHAGQNWQRFSRHLPDGAWRAGIDGLPMFFTFINGELK
jgi:hypothetical protein